MPKKPGNISLVMSMPACVCGDPRVGVLGRRLRRRARRTGLPGAQRPPGRVAGQQEAQGGGARAGKSEPEQWSHDLLLVDLGVSGVPLLDFEPVDQKAHDLVDHDALAQFVERRFCRE